MTLLGSGFPKRAASQCVSSPLSTCQITRQSISTGGRDALRLCETRLKALSLLVCSDSSSLPCALGLVFRILHALQWFERPACVRRNLCSAEGCKVSDLLACSFEASQSVESHFEGRQQVSCPPHDHDGHEGRSPNADVIRHEGVLRSSDSAMADKWLAVHGGHQSPGLASKI